MTGFLLALVVSTTVVFTAELGDKSQLMALAFGARYRMLPIVVGITVATTAVHLVSVAVGHGLGAALPTGGIALVGAVAFVGFGAWTLRGDSLTDADRTRAEGGTRPVVITVTATFFLAELGDKTMLATVTLASRYDWVGVWIGSTVGMVAADVLAIVVGRSLGRRLPQRTVAIGAATLFVGFGAWLGADAVAQLTGRSAWAAVTDVLDHRTAAWLALLLVLAPMVLIATGRRRRTRHGRGDAARRAVVAWTRLLYSTAAAVGICAPLLVAMDVVDPIPLLDDPGIVVIGAGLSLLGLALLLVAHAEAVRAPGPGGTRSLPSGALHRMARHPGITGAVLAVAGTLVMVPTPLGALAAILLVVAAQLHARGLREPRLTRHHGLDYTGYAARTGRFVPRRPQPRS